MSNLLDNENVQHKLNDQCSQIFFLFTGINGSNFMPPLKFFSTCKLLDRNIIIFRDPDKKFYMNGLSNEVGSFRALLDLQKQILAESPWVEDIYCIGTSAGGPAAALSAAELNAKETWLFAPAHPEDSMICRGYSTELEVRNIRPWNLLNNSTTTRQNLYYNHSHEKDRESALKYKNRENFVLHSMDGKGHNVMEAINERNMLESMMPSIKKVNQS